MNATTGSHARKLFLPDRRPELYAKWLKTNDIPARLDKPGRDTQVTLREITEDTLRSILDLSQKMMPGQERMVAPNAVSIAQASFNHKAWFRAIYAGDTPVGFVMLYMDDEKPEYFLWRLMITGPHQGKGYGRRAMQHVIEHVRAQPSAEELKASYVPIPGGPWPFYRSFGFEPTGEMEGNEVVIRLPL